MSALGRVPISINLLSLGLFALLACHNNDKTDSQCVTKESIAISTISQQCSQIVSRAVVVSTKELTLRKQEILNTRTQKLQSARIEIIVDPGDCDSLFSEFQSPNSLTEIIIPQSKIYGTDNTSIAVIRRLWDMDKTRYKVIGFAQDDSLNVSRLKAIPDKAISLSYIRVIHGQNRRDTTYIY